MPQVKRTEQFTISYTPADIKRLIIRDLAESHGVNAAMDDIHVRISGGDKYDANAAYSGGIGEDWQVTPVRYDGYYAEVTTHKETK